MKDMKREILEMRYAREEMRLQMGNFLFRNAIGRFEDKDIKDVFLAAHYLNTVMETVMNRQGITENDLDANNRSKYLVMKEAFSLSGVLEELAASITDEDLSTGSE